MSNKIQIKRSSTATAIPTSGQLDLGELAVNTLDGKLFFKKTDESIVTLEEYSVGDDGLTQKNFTTTLKSKLDGISSSADVNRTIATQGEAEAGASNTKAMTPLRVSQAIASLAAGGVSLSTANEWTATQTFNELALGGHFPGDSILITNEDTLLLGDWYTSMVSIQAVSNPSGYEQGFAWYNEIGTAQGFIYSQDTGIALGFNHATRGKENGFTYNSSGIATLAYQSAVKLNTSASGIAITGTATATTFIGALSGNASTATWADTVDVNGSNASSTFYDVVWHSGDTVYSSTGVEIQGSTGTLRASVLNEGGTSLISKYLGISATATDSSKLNGVASTTADTPNTIVKRDASGDINCRLLRSDFGSTNSMTAASDMVFRISASDNYFRTCTVEGVRTWLGVVDGANNYVHPTTAGNKHIPSGGSVGQVLKNTASGTATWQAEAGGITASDNTTFTGENTFNAKTTLAGAELVFDNPGQTQAVRVIPNLRNGELSIAHWNSQPIMGFWSASSDYYNYYAITPVSDLYLALDAYYNDPLISVDRPILVSNRDHSQPPLLIHNVTEGVDGLNYFYNDDKMAWIVSTTGAWATTSSIHLKDIEDIEHSRLDAVVAIGKKGSHTYYYKNDVERSNKARGFIAEYVKDYNPEAVLWNYSEEYECDLLTGMDYSAMIPDLYVAIAEQQDIIDKQDARIERLEALVEQLLAK